MSDESIPQQTTHPVEARAEDAAGRGWAWAGIGAAVLYCWVVAGFGSFTSSSTIAILGTGLVALVVAFACPPPRIATTKPLSKVGVSVWVAILASFSIQEVLNDILGSTRAHPTLSVLMDPFLGVHVVRAIALAIWIRVGWVLLRR